MARILVGVTGSVAAIKTTQLIEALGGKGYELRMVMTKSADFFLPEWNSVRPSDRVGVFRDSDEWPAKGWKRGDDVVHIELRRWADALLIAPLDAHTLAKWANGLADNLLTCLLRAWDYQKPLIIAPAMNTMMWESPITRRQLAQILSDRQNHFPPSGSIPTIESLLNSFQCFHEPIRIVPPVVKTLACGDTGTGGMAEIGSIVTAVTSLVMPNLAME